MSRFADVLLYRDVSSAFLRRLALLGAVLALQSVACGSIDDGEPASQRLQSLEEPCGADESLTGANLLDKIDGPYAAPIEYDGEDRLSRVQLSVDYRNGSVTCYPGDQGDPPRAARLEVGVELKVHTHDGVFHELVPGTVSVIAGSDQVRFSGSSPVDSSADAEPTKLLVEGWITTDRRDSQGAFRIVRGASDTSLRHHTVASWNTSG